MGLQAALVAVTTGWGMASWLLYGPLLFLVLNSWDNSLEGWLVVSTFLFIFYVFILF